MAELTTLTRQIGAKIRYFRRERDYTITQLGKMVCKSKSTISKYETGEISIDIPTLYDIAAALQVSPLALLPSEDVQTRAASGPVQGADEPMEKFYVYTYNGLAKKPLRRHILLAGDTRAEHYADVYDYEDYTRCAYYYRGTVQRTESSIRLFMENTVNPPGPLYPGIPDAPGPADLLYRYDDQRLHLPVPALFHQNPAFPPGTKGRAVAEGTAGPEQRRTEAHQEKERLLRDPA